MKVYYSDQFVLPLPPGHSFPMVKYARLRERVVEAELVAPGNLLVPPAASDDDLRRAHDPDYVARVVEGRLSVAEVREIGLPWSPELVERSRRSVGATIAAARSALSDGIAVNLAGGTHHAAAGKGAGYCVFNDVAVAARTLQAEGLIQQAIVIDCDVHHGDGTASIFAGDPSVFTFSIHGARNYPLRKPPGDLDIPLDDGTDDATYLPALERGLAIALARAGEAQLAFYLAGADPHEGDRLGRMKLSRDGLARRDALVFERCRAAGLPVAVSMAGGYGRDIEDTVAVQLETVRIAARFARSAAPRAGAAEPG